MATQMYVYSRVGQGDRIEVMRYLAELDNEPLPGGDVPTSPAVGLVVADDVVEDEAGNSVVLALDPTPTAKRQSPQSKKGGRSYP